MKNAGYTITRTEYYTQEGETLFGIALGTKKEGLRGYVTWEFALEGGVYNFYFGHYSCDPVKILVDFHERLAKKIEAYGTKKFIKMFVDTIEV